MITKEEIKEVVVALKEASVEPMNGNIYVLVPTINEQTDSGVFKGDQILKDEKDKMDAFLPVVGIAPDIKGIVGIGDKVYCQGTIVTFGEDNVPPELDINIEDYVLGIVPAAYCKSRIIG